MLELLLHISSISNWHLTFRRQLLLTACSLLCCSYQISTKTNQNIHQTESAGKSFKKQNQVSLQNLHRKTFYNIFFPRTWVNSAWREPTNLQSRWLWMWRFHRAGSILMEWLNFLQCVFRQYDSDSRSLNNSQDNVYVKQVF